MVDVLARHADVIGDLVDLVALFGPSKDSGAAQAVNRGVIGVFGVDVPFVFLNLGGDPFLPAPAEFAPLWGVGKPAAVARAKTVGRVLRALRGIEIESSR